MADAHPQGAAAGKKLGRKPVDDKIEKAIRARLAKGMGIRKVAKEVGCGVSVVFRMAHESGR